MKRKHVSQQQETVWDAIVTGYKSDCYQWVRQLEDQCQAHSALEQAYQNERAQLEQKRESLARKAYMRSIFLDDEQIFKTRLWTCSQSYLGFFRD